MGILTTCACDHDLTDHREDENGPMPCLVDDCPCEGFFMAAKVGRLPERDPEPPDEAA